MYELSDHFWKAQQELVCPEDPAPNFCSLINLLEKRKIIRATSCVCVWNIYIYELNYLIQIFYPKFTLSPYTLPKASSDFPSHLNKSPTLPWSNICLSFLFPLNSTLLCVPCASATGVSFQFPKHTMFVAASWIHTWRVFSSEISSPGLICIWLPVILQGFSKEIHYSLRNVIWVAPLCYPLYVLYGICTLSSTENISVMCVCIC